MIPFNCESCFEAHNVFSISTDPTNKYYSAITSDSILIFDAFDPFYQLLATYKRDEESIQNSGPNHWLIWMDDSTIAFGTCAGTFFCIKFSNNQFSGSIFTTNLGGVVSDVFSYNGVVGICVIGPKIIFVNNNAQITSTVEIPSMKSPFIKCPSIFSGNNFSFISGGQLIKCEFSKDKVDNLTQINSYKNVGLVCSYNGQFAFSTFDKNVYIGTTKSITKIFTTEANVVYMEFIDDGNSLLVIDQNGVFSLRNFIFNTNYFLTLSDTKTMISSFFDTHTHRFIFLDPSYQIRCINFVNLVSSFAVGSSFVYSLTKQKIFCEIPNMVRPRRIKSIPLDLYPIKSIAINTETVFCIIGRIGIAVVTELSLFYEPSINANHCVWINNMLVVFTNQMNNQPNNNKKLNESVGRMVLFTDELLPIGSLNLNLFPIFVFSSGTRLVVTYLNSFVVYEFDSTKSVLEGGEKQKHKIGKISFTSITFQTKIPIQKAFVLWDNEIILLTQKDEIINYKTSKMIWQNVKYLWINQFPQFLCCYKSGSVNILSANSIATLPINSMWTFNKNIIHLPSNLQYESIKANFTDFSMKLMPIFSNDNSKYGVALKSLLDAEDFKASLSSFLDNLNQESKLDQFYLGMRQLDSDTVIQFLNAMSDDYIGYLGDTDFDFTLHFPGVKPSIQSRILMHTSPDFLERILEMHKTLLQEKEERFKNFVCTKCIKTGQFIRGCTIANATDYNFCDLLHENLEILSKTPLSKCLITLEKDSQEWTENDRIPSLKVVGCSFNLVRLNNWALASFLLLKDEGKVTSLISDNVVNLMNAMRYTRDYKDTPYSKFLFDLQIGL
ncbi:hypothetical protein TRFO_34090 [Tritrichomonas foetus]|uniref:Uncharacterized protein n=1 Tax=Tritrichomonas foetus TaxID=1144522 RepID=A0A1J4JQA8_9EUKA|nr:hypothetical protein TRFO_34090 [Tritrichomonas foetus]|eukprot:OHS99420.1 hypothetical protein TRFO_34090 [Tritrichomonas foetus]